MPKQNSISIDDLKKTIDRLALSDTLNKNQYNPHFYNHLAHLMKFYFIGRKDENKSKFKLTERAYYSIEQSIFENPNVVESDERQEIDWGFIDDGREIFKDKIRKLLGSEGTAENMKPIIRCSADAYENWLIYNTYFPNSPNNPWTPTKNIFENGYLFLISDNRDVIEQYNKKAYRDAETKGNIGVIAKTNKKNEYSGFMVDERVSHQAFILNYLKTHANGMGNAKSVHQIVKYLAEHKRNLTAEYIKNYVNLPLKRAGIVGSVNTGYFYISSYEDLRHTYDNHVEKRDAIDRTIKTFIKKGKDMGYPNFPDRD